MTGTTRIRILAPTEADEDLWRLTSDIARILEGLPWALVGGQMVAVLEAEHGASVGFSTGDVDALVDVRAMVGVTKRAADRLLDVGFEPDVEGARGYRFQRGDAMVDLLAPDNLGARSDLRTIPPDRAVEIAGGSQALARSRPVEIEAGGGPFEVRVPSLAGAIVIKARAATQAQSGRAKHERDLARLLALVPDVASLRDELTARERAYLRNHDGLTKVSHPAWRQIPNAEDGAIALAFLVADD